MASLTEWQTLDPSRVERTVTVMVPTERPDVIRKQFEEEVKEGLMTKVSVKKAREEWREHLVVASLGAVEKNIEADEWRVVHDATHGVRVNNLIRVLDQIRFPAWPDLVAYLDEMAGDGRTARQEQYQQTTMCST